MSGDAAAPARSRTYFEDVVVGARVETPAMTLTEAHVDLYRALAAEPPDASGVIPDMLPLCLSTGLGWRVPRPPLVVLAFIGIDWEIVKAARVGDTVHSRSRTAAARGMREAGVVVEEHEIVDQRGEVVQRGRFSFLVAKRPDKETSHAV
jgi:acyl dehydratase